MAATRARDFAAILTAIGSDGEHMPHFGRKSLTTATMKLLDDYGNEVDWEKLGPEGNDVTEDDEIRQSKAEENVQHHDTWAHANDMMPGEAPAATAATGAPRAGMSAPRGEESSAADGGAATTETEAAAEDEYVKNVPAMEAAIAVVTVMVNAPNEMHVGFIVLFAVLCNTLLRSAGLIPRAVNAFRIAWRTVAGAVHCRKRIDAVRHYVGPSAYSHLRYTAK